MESFTVHTLKKRRPELHNCQNIQAVIIQILHCSCDARKHEAKGVFGGGFLEGKSGVAVSLLYQTKLNHADTYWK